MYTTGDVTHLQDYLNAGVNVTAESVWPVLYSALRDLADQFLGQAHDIAAPVPPENAVRTRINARLEQTAPDVRLVPVSVWCLQPCKTSVAPP